MTRIIATIESSRDPDILKHLIENLKGVTNVRFFSKEEITDKAHPLSKKEWIEKMLKLSNSYDSSVIDLNDERTRYIMGK